MIKLCLALIVFLSVTASYALSADNFPNAFSVKQSKCPEGKHCMILTEENDEQIGSLQPAYNKPNIFYFLDEQNQKRVTLKKIEDVVHKETCTQEFCPIFQDFDLYDHNNKLVAKLELSNDVMAFSFEKITLYTKDKKHVLMWGTHTRVVGTKSVMYDSLNSEHELALITRPLLTFSLDSDVAILDKPGLLFTLDPNVFAATLAMYCNTSLFYEKPDLSPKDATSPEIIRNLRVKLQAQAERQGLLVNIHNNINDLALKAAGNDLAQRYQHMFNDNYWDSTGLHNEEHKLQQIVEIGIDLLQSHSLTQAQDQAILQFLINQTHSHQH